MYLSFILIMTRESVARVANSYHDKKSYHDKNLVMTKNQYLDLDHPQCFREFSLFRYLWIWLKHPESLGKKKSQQTITKKILFWLALGVSELQAKPVLLPSSSLIHPFYSMREASIWRLHEIIFKPHCPINLKLALLSFHFLSKHICYKL